MDELTAGQLLGVAPYTIRGIELDADRGVWLVTVRDMCSHTNSVRELPAERQVFVETESGPVDVTEYVESIDRTATTKPKPPRKPKAKP